MNVSTTLSVELVELADQSGAVSATTVKSVAEAGIYRISTYIELAKDGSFSITPIYTWTDSIGAQSAIVNALQLGSGLDASEVFPSFIIHAEESSEIQILTSPTGESEETYDILIIIEKLA